MLTVEIARGTAPSIGIGVFLFLALIHGLRAWAFAAQAERAYDINQDYPLWKLAVFRAILNALFTIVALMCVGLALAVAVITK